MIIVSDTSPLCNLILVDYLWLLREIYSTVIIPTIVADELTAALNPSIQNICQEEWIQICTVNDMILVQKLQNQHGLDLGEAHAIALTIELKADDLLMDERLGRREALKFGLPVFSQFVSDVLFIAFSFMFQF